MYADKIEFYCMERGIIDLASWVLKQSLSLPHSPAEFNRGHMHFADIIKANAWLFRHRLDARISALEARRKEVPSPRPASQP